VNEPRQHSFFHFEWKALAVATVLFLVEVLIATKGRNLGWVRGFLGDVLAVIFVYCVFRAFLRVRDWKLALAAFAVGCVIELGQFVARTSGWIIPNPVLRIVFGSVPDWFDVLAYGIGAVVALVADRIARPGSSRIQ
jgi:glycopeptide antibiotics resistance protein